jgi:phage shock protein E
MRRFLGLLLLAGLLACGGSNQTTADISPEELLDLAASANPPLILDVRTPGEYAAGHVPGAVNIPYDQVASKIAELEPSRNRDIVVYCEGGHRAGKAYDELRANGFQRVHHLAGDMKGWRAAGREIEGS